MRRESSHHTSQWDRAHFLNDVPGNAGDGSARSAGHGGLSLRNFVDRLSELNVLCPVFASDLRAGSPCREPFPACLLARRSLRADGPRPLASPTGWPRARATPYPCASPCINVACSLEEAGHNNMALVPAAKPRELHNKSNGLFTPLPPLFNTWV